ncbi:Wzz/FepE/Etk N-terminal domain-containing protein [Desulfobacterales bacterium HSG16]|nr:Wzz/FepE/Etk N-terminal domain-containing protein [Desulfobacterales bacterium HSG16]
MEEAAKSINIGYYVDVVIKKRWFIIIPFCISMITGICISIVLPRIYKAETLILVEPKKVPDDYVKSLVTSDVRSRISTISQKIKSRMYLEKIIIKHKLFDGPEFKGMYMEDKLQVLRKNIGVKVTRSKKGTDSFKIFYQGKYPEKIKNVVNSLATYFIDQSIKVMEGEGLETSLFLAGELKAMKERLEGNENALRKYRENNMGSLPEQLNSNLRSLDRLQMKLSSKQEDFRDAKARLGQIEQAIARTHKRKKEIIVSEDPASTPEVESENLKKLTRMKQVYASLLDKYTEKHPDIIKLKIRIEKFEEIVAKELEEKPEAPEATIIPKPAQIPEADQSEVIMTAQNRESLLEIKEISSDIKKIQGQIRAFESKVEKTPEREAELLSLTRNYDNIKNQYNSLLTRKLEADIFVSMQRKSKGEQFRILDPAKTPRRPISPDMKKLLVLFIAAGLGLGGGIIFLLEFLDSSYKLPDDIEADLDLPVLATIPKLPKPRDKIKKIFHLSITLLFVMINLSLLAVFAIMSIKGVDQVKLLIKRII